MIKTGAAMGMCALALLGGVFLGFVLSALAHAATGTL